MPEGDPYATRVHPKYKRIELPEESEEYREGLRRLLCNMLTLKVQNSMSHDCVDSILNMLRAEPGPENYKKCLPQHFGSLLATLDGLGVPRPVHYMYDCCPRCNFVYSGPINGPKHVVNCPACGEHRFGDNCLPLAQQTFNSLEQWVQHLFLANWASEAAKYHVQS